MAVTLTRWDPFGELVELRTRLDHMFDGWLDGPERAWMPAIDVVREDTRLVVRADLPGIRPEDVNIEVEDDIVTISGEHRETIDENDAEYLRRERRYGYFHRSLPLPAGVDAKTIEAKTLDGVVVLTIPLPQETRQEAVKITPTAS
jgi:HSP20 family protein